MLLRRQPEGVDLVARDAAPRGDALGGTELVGHVPREVVGTRAPGAVDDVHAEAHPAHDLDPTRDPDVDGARADEVGDKVVGLLRRAALAVDGGGRHLVGHARAEPCVAGDVRRLLSRLGDAPAHDLLDLGRVDARALHDLDLGRRQQLGRVQARQPPVAPADRRAHRLHDHRLGHPLLLSWSGAPA